MSRGSEYASAVGNLYQLQAQNIAQRNQAQANARLQKANIWAGTLSNLGQMVANLPQQMRERKIAGLKEQELLAGFEDKRLQREKLGKIQSIMQQAGGKITPQVVEQITAVDLDAGELVGKIYQEAKDREKKLTGERETDELNEFAGIKLDDPSSIMTAHLALKSKYPDQDYSYMLGQDIAPRVARAQNLLRTQGQRDTLANPPPPSMVGIPTVQNGVEGILRTPENVEGFFPSPPKEKTPVPIRTVENGREVTKFVIPTPDMVIPAPPQNQPKDDRLVQVVGPGGAATWEWESQAAGKQAAQAPRAVTGAERQSLAFYNRAQQAVDTLTSPDPKGGPSLEDRIGADSGVLNQLNLQYGNSWTQNDDQQAYRQAQRAFTEARLRKESGAAIPNAEYENDAKTYFKQPGDSPATIRQKQVARQVVLDGLKFSSGKAYDEFYGESARTAGTQPTAPTAPTVGSEITFNGKRYRIKGIENGQAVLTPIP